MWYIGPSSISKKKSGYLIRKWDLYYSEESCKIMVDNLELSVILIENVQSKHNQIKIVFNRQKDLDYVISASCGNFLYLNSIINFLDMKEYLSGDSKQTVCREIPEGLLSEVLHSYILHTLNEQN